MAVEQFDEFKVVVTLAMPGLTIAQNVYYARYTAVDDITPGEVGGDMLAWSDDMYGNILGQMGDTVSISEVSTFRKVTAVPLVFETLATFAGTQVGGSTGEVLPNGVALVMRAFPNALKSIARKYIAGIVEIDALTTTWSSTLLANAASFLFDWIAGPATVGARTYESGIISTKDGLFKTFLSGGVLSVIPGYQRRRKPGVGV